MTEMNRAAFIPGLGALLLMLAVGALAAEPHPAAGAMAPTVEVAEASAVMRAADDAPSSSEAPKAAADARNETVLADPVGEPSDTGNNTDDAGTAQPTDEPGLAEGAESDGEVGGVATDETTESPEVTKEKARLRERVQARWDALVKGDYDTVYEFASPTYREVFSKRHFLRGHSRQVKRTGIEIDKIEFTNDERTQARVSLYILYKTELWGGQLYEGRRFHREAWVKEDGEWWRVEDS